jgi:hypothetical protein
MGVNFGAPPYRVNYKPVAVCSGNLFGMGLEGYQSIDFTNSFLFGDITCNTGVDGHVSLKAWKSEKRD